MKEEKSSFDLKTIMLFLYVALNLNQNPMEKLTALIGKNG